MNSTEERLEKIIPVISYHIRAMFDKELKSQIGKTREYIFEQFVIGMLTSVAATVTFLEEELKELRSGWIKIPGTEIEVDEE